jgi:hypothetical protein
MQHSLMPDGYQETHTAGQVVFASSKAAFLLFLLEVVI